VARRIPITAEQLERECALLAPITKGFELLTDQVVITDVDSNILYANKPTQDKTGFTLEEMLGKNPGDLWGGHMSKENYVKMYHALKDLKQSWHGPVKNRHRDGNEYWQWLIVNPILNENNECIYFVAIEPDIDRDDLVEPEQISQALVDTTALTNALKAQSITIADLTKIVEDLKNKLDNYTDQKSP